MYEGVIVQIKKNTINKYNVEILFEHIVDEDPFIVECLLEKETYGKDKFWILI